MLQSQLHRQAEESCVMSDSLSKANEVLMVGVHVGQLDVHTQDQLLLAPLLTLTDTRVHDALSVFS